MIRADLQKELQERAEQICRENNKTDYPAIHIKRFNRRGHTNKTGFISIPGWAVDEGNEYLTYYLLHEVTHWLIAGGHTKEFRNKEIELLNRVGLEPIYNKVYVKGLVDKTGRAVWVKNW